MSLLEQEIPRRAAIHQIVRLGAGAAIGLTSGPEKAIEEMKEYMRPLETVIAKQVFSWSIVVDNKEDCYRWGVYRTEVEALAAYEKLFAHSDYSETLKQKLIKFNYKNHLLVGVGGQYKPSKTAGLITVNHVQGKRGKEKELRLDVSGRESPYYWYNDQSIAFLSIRKQGGRIMVIDNIDIEFQEPPNFRSLLAQRR